MRSLALLSILCIPWPVTQTKNNKPDTKKLKILVVVKIFPEISQRYVINQIVGLIKNGHTVSIYAQKEGTLEKIHSDILNYDLMSKLYIKELPEDINEYDVVICQHGNCGRDFLRLKKKYKIPAKLATFFRGYEIWGGADKSPGCYRKLFKYGDCFFTNCKVFKDRAIELGCPAQKIHVNYSSISLNDIPYTPKEPDFEKKISILTTGRLHAKKGIETVLSAVALLVKKYPHIHYTIAGEGYLRKSLEKQARDLGIDDIVTFYGCYTSSELPEILNNADIFIAPSVTPTTSNNKDALTNTIKEAMANGLPIIATNHGGIPEFIKHGENGLLVEEYDIQGIADQIEFILENPHLVNEFGTKGRQLVEEHFELSHQTNQLIEYLKELVFGKNINSPENEKSSQLSWWGRIILPVSCAALIYKICK